jgi:hypothetical protein
MTTLLFALLFAMQGPEPAKEILGVWHGTSLCVDKKIDTACHDEEVIYTVDSAATPRGPVRMQADKIVNGQRLDMGTFHLKYDSTTHAWSDGMHTPSGHDILWMFEPRGQEMNGALLDLPSRRVVRRVAAKRIP